MDDHRRFWPVMFGGAGPFWFLFLLTTEVTNKHHDYLYFYTWKEICIATMIFPKQMNDCFYILHQHIVHILHFYISRFHAQTSEIQTISQFMLKDRKKYKTLCPQLLIAIWDYKKFWTVWKRYIGNQRIEISTALKITINSIMQFKYKL